MKALILIALFLICLVGGFILFVVLRFTRVSKKRVAIAATVAILFFATVWYCLRAFSLAFENHYDVKRGTLLWFMTMDNATINDFPLIKSISKPVFNKIGGGGPGISAGWEIEYTSAATYGELTKSINQFLTSKGYRIKEVAEPACVTWTEVDHKSTTHFFSAQNENGECLDLCLDVSNNTVRVEVTLLF